MIAKTESASNLLWVPKDFVERITATHAAGAATVRASGFEPEPEATAVWVENHRWCWKPRETRLVLIAESHVLTTAEDLKVTVDCGRLTNIIGQDAQMPPSTYVGLIYCLGYGESELLGKRHQNFKARNTIQFWDLFGRVTNSGKQPRRSQGASLDDRIRWKISTLKTMQEAGIWLLDASVHAIYRGRKERLPFDVRRQLQEQWWTGYGQGIVEKAGTPEIWCIGKTTFDILSPLLNLPQNRWVYQPGARDVDLERNWPSLLSACERLLGNGDVATPP